MRFPRRSLRSIQALPSIYTAFPTSYDSDSRNTSANEYSGNDIEEGIELVPIERSNTTSAKILSPGNEEKEVVLETPLAQYISAKPLPRLPKPRWRRLPKTEWNQLPVKQRIFILLGIQISMLMTICLSLLSIKRNTNPAAELQSTSTEAPFSMPSAPPLTRGTFALALGKARQETSDCLANANDSAAWTCTDDALFQMDVFPSPYDRTEQTLVAISSFRGSSVIKYGQQPLDTMPVELTPTVDPDFPEYGPAYQFRVTYNRTVLLREDQLSEAGPPPGQPSADNTAIHPNERPWLCFFNETVVEGFVYASQRSASSNKSVDLVHANDTNISVQTPYFPYTLRIREQLLTNEMTAGSLPYCQKMKVTGSGELVVNGTSKHLLALNKRSFDMGNGERDKQPENGGRKRQPIAPQGTCQCQWIVQ